MTDFWMPPGMQPRLQALIEGSGENWIYAIFWLSKSDFSLGWGDGYYDHWEEEKKLRKKAASPNTGEEQAHRKKVLRELKSLFDGADGDDGADGAVDEEVTDTEWFFLESMTYSFRFGSGLPGQALSSSRPIWVAGDQLAAFPCERARQSLVLGIRTIVSIPTAYGVVELGSTQFSTSSKFALLERVKQLMPGIDGLDLGSPSNSLFTMDEIQEFLRTPSPPPTNQTDKLNVGVWQGDGGECVAEDAALAHDRAVFMLRGDKAPLNFPQLLEHIKTAEPTMAQQENPDEDSGLGNDEVETFGTGAEGTGEVEMVEGQSDSGCLENGKRKGKTLRGERGNNRTAGVKIAIPGKAKLIDAAKNLNDSLQKWILILLTGLMDAPNYENESEEAILMETFNDCNGELKVGMKVFSEDEAYNLYNEYALRKGFSIRRGNKRPDLNGILRQREYLCSKAGYRKIGSISEVKEFNHLETRTDCKARIRFTIDNGIWTISHLNDDHNHELASPEERRNLRSGRKVLKAYGDVITSMVAAVSRSTPKRVCREYRIDRWQPRKKHKLINQSHPDEIPAVVDLVRIPQSNSDTLLPNQSHPDEIPAVADLVRIPQSNSDTLLPSNQISSTVDKKNGVTVKARYGKLTIKFQLSWPWEKMELERQVKQRLKLEAGSYYAKYKDEDNELILIACDEDLQNYISSSSLLGTRSIEVFLEPK